MLGFSSPAGATAGHQLPKMEDRLLQSGRSARHQKHMVFFTHNEQSHIAHMLSLARHLASLGAQITCALPATSYASYCSTNNANINPSLPLPNLRVEPVAESPMHSSNDLLLLHKKLEEGLVQLIRCLQPLPSILVADMVYYKWLQPVANSLGVTLFLFAPFLATTLLLTCHLPELLQKGLLPFQAGMQDEVIDFIPGLMKGFRVADIPVDFLGRSSTELESFNFLEHCKACAGIVLCSTSYALEVEAEAMDALAAHGLRIYPLAPMLHMDWFNNSTVLYQEDDKCVTWLDRQPNGSVVYAAFGSIIPLTEEEVQELALGLEACGQPFLWVLRNVEGASDPISVLPPGFLERISNKGCIISWAPQMAVLSHPSVGCFISHCGVASLLEAVWTGVPVIGCFYKFYEQNTGRRIMTDGWKVGLSMNVQSSGLRSSISEAIKELMDGQRVGAAIKQLIMQLKGALMEGVGPNGISRRYLEQLVDVLLSPAEGVS